MNLANLKHLSALNKLQLLRTTGGLTMLANALAQGHSISQIAVMIGITSETMCRWQAVYPEINNEIVPYIQAAYRIIYAYDDRKTYIRGCIVEEFDTLEAVWNSIFVQQYFSTFKKSELDYYESYLAAMRNTGFYKLSNYYLIIYGTVNKKGYIKPCKPPV